MKGIVLPGKHKTETVTIKKLIILYGQSNLAEGKSEKTISWYQEILSSFCAHLVERTGGSSLSSFSLENARDYMLYLRQKPKYQGHPYTPMQDVTVSDLFSTIRKI